MTRTIQILPLLLLVACGDSPDGRDASTPLDAGTRDGGDTPDAGSGDADGDGVPDAMDCQPADAAIGRTDSRACATACGDGVEVCADGVYAACSAGTDCVCDTEGARQVVECGMCGLESQECRSGRWAAISECLGQGECTFGDVEDRMIWCGHDQRLCDVTCQWSEWTVLTPRGECEAGMRGDCFAPPLDDYLCTADCQLADDPDCNAT